ncbi:MAG: exo-alpha-sialidase [Pirellulales bacterium]
MSKRLVALTAFAIAFWGMYHGVRADEQLDKLELIEVRKVWDRGTHNAFTDLIRHREVWYLAFREAPYHGVPNVGQPGGKARVLRSKDAKNWQSAGLLDFGENQDVRDPKLSVTPDGRLMVTTAVAPHANKGSRQPIAWYSRDGRAWGEPQKIGELNWWLWRVTWGPDGKAYGVGYGEQGHGPSTTRLYRSDDGVKFNTIVKQLTAEPKTNETTIRFLKNGTAIALVRRDGGVPPALVVSATGDYTAWSFRGLNKRIGGPDFFELPDGRLIAGVRLYDKKVRTALCWLDVKKGELTEALALPSGGDTSYPGLVWHDDTLWVSYYSSHQGKSSIYLARVKVH